MGVYMLHVHVDTVATYFYLKLSLVGKIIVQNCTRRHETTNGMKTLVHLLAAVSLVEVDARIITKDKNIATALMARQN